MDMISFIVGFILGIMGLKSDRIKVLMRVILCSITAGYILKLIYPTLYIWTIIDYNNSKNYSAFFHSNLSWISFLLVVLLYLFFYWLGHLIIDKTILKKMSLKFDTTYAKMNENDINSVHLGLNKIVKGVINVLLRLRLLKADVEIKPEKKITYIEFKELINSTFLTSIHIFCCFLIVDSIFSFNKFVHWILLLLLIVNIAMLFMLIKVVPFFRHFLYKMTELMKIEYNKKYNEHN